MTVRPPAPLPPCSPAPLAPLPPLLPMPPPWFKSLEHRYSLDLRSLALLRLTLALVILGDLWSQGTDLLAQGSDLGERSPVGYWSIHGLGGALGWQMGWQMGWQVGCFAIATCATLLMLIGYRTRWATIIAWGMLVSLHHHQPPTQPPVIYAPDELLRTTLFWAMFLPWGSAYSVDQALNTSPQPPPKQIFSGATLALMAQQFYFLLLFYGGPLLLWSPIRSSRCRLVAVGVIGLHGTLALTLGLDPTFSVLSCITWLAFIPTPAWEYWQRRAFTPKQLGLKIYYDADCGFCKKVVHLLRTFLLLPRRVPLQTAQSDPVIHTAMETHNSWVIVDWQGKHHYKWHGIAYVVSLSPIVWPLARVLRWSPLMALGNRCYETIANNRQVAGNFTKPFKFQSFTVRPPGPLSLLPLALLLMVSLWHLGSMTAPGERGEYPLGTPPALQRLTAGVQPLGPLVRAAGLDRSWPIYPPLPPRPI